MVYRDALRHSCKRCGKIREPGERFSVRGRCRDCGDAEMLRQVNEMRDHQGEYFQAWRRKMAATVGGVLLDDLPPEQ